MFLTILLFPFNLLLEFALPLVGTVFAKQNHGRWIAFWLITLLQLTFVTPFLSLLFEGWVISLINILIAVAKLVVLKLELVTLDLYRLTHCSK